MINKIFEILKNNTNNNFIVTGGVADDYHFSDKLNLNNFRDLDIIVTDDSSFIKLKEAFSMSIANNSLFIAATKKYDMKQLYGKYGSIRIDIFLGKNVEYIEVQGIKIASIEHRLKYLQAFIRGVVPYVLKSENKLINYKDKLKISL